ncbi:MAG TPA: hypothetical protein VF618_26130 [Thermoanaerobaculia bacterium]
MKFYRLPLLVLLLMVSGGSLFAIDSGLGCGADLTASQCIALNDGVTETYSILCTSTYGCKWCDLTVGTPKSVCTLHRFSPGFCECSGPKEPKVDPRYGYLVPVCEVLRGSCKYV